MCSVKVLYNKTSLLLQNKLITFLPMLCYTCITADKDPSPVVRSASTKDELLLKHCVQAADINSTQKQR